MTRIGSRHARRLLLASMLALLNTFCAAIDRGRSRHALAADAEYALAGDRSYGCEGEVLDEQHHHQAGGKVTYRFEHRKGFNLQADAGVVRARLHDHRGFAPYKHTYTMGGGGLTLGADWKYVGFDLGMGLLIDDEMRSMAMPRVEIRAGRMEHAWWESGVGPLGVPFDGRLLYTGFGLAGDWGGLKLGVAAVGRPMVDLAECEDELHLGILADGPGDPGGYAQAHLALGRGIWLRLGAIASESYSLRLGLGFDL